MTTLGRVYLGKNFETAFDYAIRGYGDRFKEMPLIHIFEVDTKQLKVENDPDDDEPSNCTVRTDLLLGQHIKRYKEIQIFGLNDGYDKLDDRFHETLVWKQIY